MTTVDDGEILGPIPGEILDPLRVTEPGVYPDLDEDTYHRDPVPPPLGGSLSASGSKLLLAPNCPALFKWYRDNGRPTKPAYELGHAAHRLALGAGAEIEEIKADNWRTNAANLAADKARAAGRTPLLTKDYETVQAMAVALLKHPLAAALLAEQTGQPEQSMFWVDPDTGVWRRARFDWLPNRKAVRMVIVDYKTTLSSEPKSFEKSIVNFGYDIQDATYKAAARALDLDDDPALVFITQMKTPPYLVTVGELDPDAQAFGRARARRALEVYAECQSSGVWPAWTAPDEVAQFSLPRWATYDQEYI